ncbi:chromate transporter [bacterium]|nr:chromate transporter [bacterium]
MEKKSLFEIYKVFFIIGMQLLGGGYVIVPLLKKYIVEERNWMTDEELVDFFAMSQCIPGIIAGNIAICSGYKARGIIGAIMAILGIITSPFISIIILANILSNVLEYPIVQHAFEGIRISVVILILVTIKDLWAKSVNSVFTYIMFFLILIALFLIPVSPTLIIIISAIIALLYGKFKGVKNA